MKVLYLSYDGLTDPLGQSQVLPYIINLAGKGHRFHIISFEKEKEYFKHSQVINQKIKDCNITWEPLVYHKTPPILSTIYDLYQMRRAAIRVVRTKSTDLVHARSYLPGLIADLIKRKFKIPFLFDIRGFWADERVDGGLWKLSNPVFRIIYNYIKRKEYDLMHSANHIISLTHAGKDEISSGNLFKKRSEVVDSDIITVIPCAVDLELFDPEKVQEQRPLDLRASLGYKNDDQIILYLGSIGTWYLLDEMIQYFKKYNEKHSRSKFLFVSRDNPEFIFRSAEKHGVSRDLVTVKSSSREDVPVYLKMADLGLFFIKPSYSKKASSATKMGEMLAMELPVITNTNVGDNVFLAEEFDLGDLVDLNNELILTDSLATPDFDKSRLYFSLETAVEKYNGVYQTISDQEN